MSCAGPGGDFDNLSGSLPTQDILRFYENISFLCHFMPVVCFLLRTAHFCSPSSLRKRCRAAFHKTRRQRPLTDPHNTTACRICHIFIFHTIVSHKRDVIGSPTAFQEWWYKPPIRSYDPEHHLSIFFIHSSFHLSLFHPILFLLSGVPWLNPHVLPLPFELKSQEKKYMSTGKATGKQTADFKYKATYSQTDLENCFGMYLNAADLHKM